MKYRRFLAVLSALLVFMTAVPAAAAETGFAEEMPAAEEALLEELPEEVTMEEDFVEEDSVEEDSVEELSTEEDSIEELFVEELSGAEETESLSGEASEKAGDDALSRPEREDSAKEMPAPVESSGEGAEGTEEAMAYEAPDAKSAFRAYKSLLESSRFSWPRFNSGTRDYSSYENVASSSLRFGIAYVDKDSVPELIVERKDNPHYLGYQAIYTFYGGKAVFLAVSDVVQVYPRTGVFRTLYNGMGGEIRYYILNGAKASLQSAVPSGRIGGTAAGDIDFYANTSANRNKILDGSGTSSGDRPQAPSSVGGAGSLKARPSGVGRVELTWSPAENANTYIILRMTDQEGCRMMGYTAGCSWTDTKALSTGFNYYWVYPYYIDSAAGIKKPGTLGSYVYAYGHGVGQVKNFQAKTAAKGTTLTWSAAEGANGYVILSRTGSPSARRNADIVVNNTTSYADLSAPAGAVTYYWVYGTYTVGNKRMASGRLSAYSSARGSGLGALTKDQAKALLEKYVERDIRTDRIHVDPQGTYYRDGTEEYLFTVYWPGGAPTAGFAYVDLATGDARLRLSEEWLDNIGVRMSSYDYHINLNDYK